MQAVAGAEGVQRLHSDGDGSEVRSPFPLHRHNEHGQDVENIWTVTNSGD